MTGADLAELAATLSASVGPDGQPRIRTDAERWIEWNTRNYEVHDFGLWVIETHEGRFVGDCGLTVQSVQSVEGKDFVEFGWHVHPDLQGQGYATEAAAAVRTTLEQNRLTDHPIAIIHPENRASQRVAEKIGLRLERRVHRWDQPALIFGVDLPSPSTP